MDPNWIMAIIAISAIFSPAIVSIIDNIFNYKSKKLELEYPNKRNSLTTFVDRAMRVYNTQSFKDVVNYHTAKNDLYIYFNNVPDKLIEKLENTNKNSFSDYKLTLNSIIKKLSLQINK